MAIETTVSWLLLTTPLSVDLGGSKLSCPTLLLVDFFRRTWEESHAILILDISHRSGDICDQSLKLFKVDTNFARFWPPISVGGGAPKCWDLDYKIEITSDHVAKFQGDWPRELWDLAL